MGFYLQEKTAISGARNGIMRWYDPITGRWLSSDPIGISGGLNQYVFCGNNPINLVDPWGLTDGVAYPTMDAAAIAGFDQMVEMFSDQQRSQDEYGFEIYTSPDRSGKRQWKHKKPERRPSAFPLPGTTTGNTFTPHRDYPASAHSHRCASSFSRPQRGDQRGMQTDIGLADGHGQQVIYVMGPDRAIRKYNPRTKCDSRVRGPRK